MVILIVTDFIIVSASYCLKKNFEGFECVAIVFCLLDCSNFILLYHYMLELSISNAGDEEGMGFLFWN